MAHEALCPACCRIRDQYPAGFLSLHGGCLDQHKQEIINLVRHEEKAETAEHPLHRIMQIEEQADGILITTAARVQDSGADQLPLYAARDALMSMHEASHPLLLGLGAHHLTPADWRNRPVP